MLGMGWFPSTLGGLDRYYRALFEQLPEAGGVVIGPAGDAPASIRVAARAGRSLPRRVLSYWAAARRADTGSGIVDAHFALYAAAPLLLGVLRRRPSVFHFHGPWADESVAAQDRSRVRFAARRALERRVLGAVDAHVVLSSAFRRLLVERYRVAPWNVHVWPPGVAHDVFTPGERASARARLELDQDAFVAVCVRRLVPRMGIGGLLDAWAEIEADLAPGSTLLLVGDGASAGELAERAAQPPLAGRVRLLGRVADDVLLDAYRAADVAVVPTLAFEGFGLVVLEAAACGTPSIVSAVGGLPEVAAQLDPSLIVGPGDVAGLGGRLQAAAGGELPSRAATRRYAERFSWPELARRHRELYSRLATGERDERLRVVFLDHVARLSGGEIALLRMLPHLEHVHAHVILGEDGPFAERLQQAGISVEVLALADSAREVRREAVRAGGAWPLAALHTLVHVLRLARRLHELRPDLVHTNSLKSGVYGSVAAKLARVPLVWHVRDRIAEDYVSGFAVRLVRGLVSRLADGVIANSTATLETLSDRERDRGSVIPDSVEISPHPPAPDATTVTFGMLGRIAPWKGQDLFLRAFAAAFAAGSERAVIVGTPMFGEEGYERELHELVAQLGLAGRVDFRGFREDIWRELASFDVLVHASVIPEPFGQVVLEGMAAGLPVVAPDEGGPAELIDDGRTGRLFRSRDAESLAATLVALRADGAERRRLGEAAQRSLGAYSPGALAERVEHVYRRVLTERSRPTRRRR
jgi:glycosyltransferase involved in cell wall biosynthesis